MRKLKFSVFELLVSETLHLAAFCDDLFFGHGVGELDFARILVAVIGVVVSAHDSVPLPDSVPSCVSGCELLSLLQATNDTQSMEKTRIAIKIKILFS